MFRVFPGLSFAVQHDDFILTLTSVSCRNYDLRSGWIRAFL